jgi:hypothetical protein
MEGRRFWPNLGYYHIFLEGLGKTMKNLSHPPSKYKSEALMLEPSCSVPCSLHSLIKCTQNKQITKTAVRDNQCQKIFEKKTVQPRQVNKY